MNVSKKVEAIQKLQSRYVKLQKEIQGRIHKITKPIERHIKQRLKDEFPEADVYFLSGFQCGCLTDTWTPQIYVYRVNGLSYSPEGYWYEEQDKNFKKHLPPVPSRRLLTFLKTLTDEVGVKVTLVRQKPYWLNEQEYQLENKGEMLLATEERIAV